MNCLKLGLLVSLVSIACVDSSGVPVDDGDAGTGVTRQPPPPMGSDAGSADVMMVDAQTDTQPTMMTDARDVQPPSPDTSPDMRPDLQPDTQQPDKTPACVPNRCARDSQITCTRDKPEVCGGVCAGPSPIAGKFCSVLGGTATDCAYCDNDPTRSCTFVTGCPNGGKCLSTNCVPSPSACCGS